MLSSLAKFIPRPGFSLSLIQQQYLFASSSSKRAPTSSSTGDTPGKGTDDVHDPQMDTSHQTGSMTQQERDAWMKKEHDGYSPGTKGHTAREFQKETK